MKEKFIESAAASRDEIALQAASLTALPLWWPLYARSLYKRTALDNKGMSYQTFFGRGSNNFRGMTANLALQPLYPLAGFVLTTLLQKIEKIQQRDPVLAEKIVASFITGCSTALVANPYETTVIESQRRGESPPKAFMRILGQSGVKGLFTGMVPMAIRNGTFLCGLFVTTPELKKWFEKHMPGSGVVHQMAASLLGATVPATIFTCVAIPFDLAAILRQSDPDKQRFHSTLHVLQQVYRKHGLSAIKTGLLLRAAATCIEMAGVNLLKDKYHQALSDLSEDRVHLSEP